VPATGYDISQHQRSVNHARAKRGGEDFCVFKTSEGQDFADPRGTRGRYVSVRRAELLATTYHYLRPKQRDAKLEMDHYVRRLKVLGYPRKNDLPPVIDIEESELSGEQTRRYLVRAVEQLVRRRGPRRRRLHPNGCIIYGSPSFLLEFVRVQDSPELRRLTRAGLVHWWIAHFNNDPGNPAFPASVMGRKWLWHQWTSSGSIDGFAGRIDRNIARADLSAADLRRMLGYRAGAAPPPPPPPPPPPSPPPPQRERIRRLQRDLRSIGWPLTVDGIAGPRTRQAVREFKRGYTFHRFRRFDGSIGRRTRKIIHACATERDGRCSKHFRFREFASTTRPGGCRGNGWIKVHRDLVVGLEKLREIAGPIGVLNGHRDPHKNACVGGASNSQHLFGNGIDPNDPLPSTERVKALRCFSGIGFQGSTGAVRHVDVRHVGPNTTGGSPERPTIWRYAT
jgi:lysozyme